MDYNKIIKKLKSFSNSENVAGMERFGINPKFTLGINIPVLRGLAKGIQKDPKYKNQPKKLHTLAKDLWNSKVHEARILAAMIDAPELVTEKQMDSWISDFDSWDVCDQVCMNLFDKTPFAFKKAGEWTKKEAEFEKRSAFSLMACLAVHDKASPNVKFEEFFQYIKAASTDERNYVKKAVNWALRQIGKRNKELGKRSIKLAEEIIKTYPNSKPARWIAKDAIRELTSHQSPKT
jgi:3-methyladenine DNA glycosylase AlkD